MADGFSFAFQVPWWAVALIVVGIVCAVIAVKFWGASSH
jgi:hypothetical protein